MIQMFLTAAPQSEMQLRRFAKSRAAVQDALGELMALANELGAVRMHDQLREASRQLADDVFRVVVMGEFSNGKSTLINALLGAKVLPSSSLPTTTVLTVIRNGEEPDYSLLFKDGAIQQMSRNEFDELVAPREPDEDDPSDLERYRKQLRTVAQVDLASVTYPNPLCAEGVVIVDTPGTNDLDAVRERITYEFVPQADAAIVVLSARQPLSAKEMEFLTARIMKADVGRLFFVVNFKDFLKSERDQAKQLRYISEHLNRVVPGARIFLVCSRDALIQRAGLVVKHQPLPMEETGIPSFERELGQFLESARSAVKLERPILIGMRIGSDLAAGPLATRRSAIGLSAEQLKQKIAATEPDLVRARNEQREVLDGLKAQLDEEGERIRSELKRGLDSVINIGVSAARDYQGDLTPAKICEAVERAVGRRHTDELDKAKKRQRETLAEHCARAEKRMKAAWDKVQVKFQANFDVPLTATSLSLPQVTSDDDIAKFSLGGGAGAVALVALAGLAFPVAIIAGIAAFFGLGAHQEAQRRKKLLDEVVPQIRARLSEGVEPTVAAFADSWNRSASGVCQTFDDAFTARVESISTELRRLANEHFTERRKATEAEEYCDGVGKRLELATQSLRSCRW